VLGVQRLPVLIAASVILVSTAVTGCSRDDPEADARASKAAASATAEAMRSTSPRIFQDSPVSPECDEAMAGAADVPLAETNDAAMQEAAEPCSTADEYAQAVYAHPDTIGLTNFTDQDVLVTMQAVCSSSGAGASPTGMCSDLAARGLSRKAR